MAAARDNAVSQLARPIGNTLLLLMDTQPELCFKAH